jgi:MtN3 and saliva related transmembrane protein
MDLIGSPLCVKMIIGLLNLVNAPLSRYFCLIHKRNSMNYIDLIGYLGSFLSCITFIPQVYKTWQTRSAGDLSLTMLFIVLTSTVVWLIYAFALLLWPVIICNGIMFVLVAMLIYFKLTYIKN